MNTLIPGAPLRSLSPTSIEYQRAQGASRAAKPVRAARFTLDAPEHSGTIPGAIGDILPPGVALTSNLAVIFTLNQYSVSTGSKQTKPMRRLQPKTPSQRTACARQSAMWIAPCTAPSGGVIFFVSSVKLRWMNSRFGQFEFQYSPSPQARSRR